MRSLEFTRAIGAGAFGTVYLADLLSGQGFRRQVAVKVIQRNRPDSDMFLTRIRDEARLLGLLQDDAILKVLDMVKLDGLDAVIMEYVEGVDLDTVVKADKSPPPRALAELAAAVAGALSRAHTAVHPSSGESLNVIHRDVKPANIMVTSTGGVKLCDFGVARARFDARESYTGQLVLGTLNYMAPEYIVTGEVSPAADIYGLALSLWEVAAGEVYGQPKVRQDSHEKRIKERLAQIEDGHKAFVPVLREMLNWNPADRPKAAEVERLLLESADADSGTGLRSWATANIPAVLTNRQAPKDTLSLINRTISLSSTEEESPLLDEETQSSDETDSGGLLTPQRTVDTVPVRISRPSNSNIRTPASGPQLDSEATRPTPPPKSPIEPPARASQPSQRKDVAREAFPRSAILLIIQGLVIGGGLGLMAVLLLAVILYSSF